MDIHHGMMVRGVKPERVYEALTRQADLAIWMGASTLARPEVGSMIEFQFDQGKFSMQMEVIRLEAGALVQWRQIRPIWRTVKGVAMPGQIVTWTLSTPYDSGTLVDFRMGGWLDDDETYSSNSFKWAFGMLRLRVYLGHTHDLVDLVPWLTGNHSL